LQERPALSLSCGAGLLALILAPVLVIVLASGGGDNEDVVGEETPGSDTPTASAEATQLPRSIDIKYSTQGGPLGENHLIVVVTVIDDGEQPVHPASVSAELNRDGALYATKSGTTGPDGSVDMRFTNAPAGCYDMVITDVTAAGFLWDSIYPDNGFEKGSAVC
jgi:hypothetical protein